MYCSLFCCVCFVMCVLLFCFCFFKQKTAYEMRISDWSSDVCSSDLIGVGDMLIHANYQDFQRYVGVDSWIAGEAQASLPALTAIVRRGMTAAHRKAIGRASCRERVCQYV